MHILNKLLYVALCMLALGASKASVSMTDTVALGGIADDCTSDNQYFFNTTGSHTLIDPFRTPNGNFSNGSGNWTWNIGTESYNSSAPSTTSIRQLLWLKVEPLTNYFPHDPYHIGCGLIFHGLKESVIAKGQNDTGTCGSVLSDKCSAFLLNVTAELGKGYSSSSNGRVDDICNLWQTDMDFQKRGAPSECSETFEKWAWIQGFPFISSQIQESCSGEGWSNSEDIGPPNAEDNVLDVTQPLTAWGESSYSSTNLTAYNNLTTSITPLITVLIANHTTDFNWTNSYSQSQLVCLKPSDVEAGSLQPSVLPTSEGVRRRLEASWLWLALIGMAYGFVFA